MKRRTSSVLAFAALTAVSSFAIAALMQPDGTPIPVGPSLQNLFDSRGESIDALNDAANVPETFIPSCALEFEVLQRNAGYKNSFGWYNVTGQKPLDSELYEFLSCNDPVGTKKVLDIKNDPNYAGGEIGFYEATGPCGTTSSYLDIFYSEKKYNPDSGQQNPYTHLLVYDSTVTPKAFYFAWEDLLSGGDNDFDDLTTFVTGITCSGGGGACQTGQLGICADGTMQCQSGVLTCVPSNEAKPEACNALDDDCNGETDEGDDLCPPGEVCDKGTCVPACEGEFGCVPPKVCDDGYCVDPGCVDLECPSGQKCVRGACVGPCDGVVCPYGQVCLVGTCVDPCDKLVCDRGQVCVLGACVDACQCAGCALAESCQPDGLCIPTACEGVQCPDGQHCTADGTCVDDCEGAKCPAGEICVAGECVEDPSQGEGGAGGGAGTGGTTFEVGGGSPTGGGTEASATGTGGSASNADPGRVVEASGCGCRVSHDRGPGALVALGLLLLSFRRRRAG